MGAGLYYEGRNGFTSADAFVQKQSIIHNCDYTNTSDSLINLIISTGGHHCRKLFKKGVSRYLFSAMRLIRLHPNL
jgi:hypothetical protein